MKFDETLVKEIQLDVLEGIVEHYRRHGDLDFLHYLTRLEKDAKQGLRNRE